MRMRGGYLGCVLLLASACAGPHLGGRKEAAVSIGVCFGAGLKPGQAEQIGERLARQDVELVGCLALHPAAGDTPLVEWRRPVAREGLRAAAPLPQRPVGARFGYSFERGPLHVTVIETADPMKADSEAYHWLMDDLSLAGKPPAKPWKVVIMSRPIFSLRAMRVDRERLDLAELLAREGVALAIATGGPPYFRSERIGGSPEQSSRYVALGGDGALDPARIPPWSARALDEPCFCVLNVSDTVFRWATYDLQGRLVDLLEFPAAARTASRAESFTLSEVLAGELPSDE